MDKTKENNIINFPDHQIADIENSVKVNKTQKKRKKNNSSHFIILVAIVTFVFTVIVFSILDNSEFNSTDAVNTEPISILSTANYCFADYKEGYVFAKDGKISCYNTNQELQWEIDSSKTAPTIMTNGEYVLTYYNKDKLAVVTNGAKTHKIKTDGNVIYGSVNKNGYCALIVEEDGFKSQIAVYDNKGKLKVKWHNSERYIASVALSDNNKTLIASEIKLLDSDVNSSVLITDIRSELSFDEIDFKDSVICDLKFNSKNKFIAVLDDRTVCYSTGKNQKWRIDYAGKNLYTYDISNTNNIALVFDKDDSALSNSVVEFYNESGKQIGSYASESRIYKLDMQEKTSLIAYDRNIEVVNSKGRVISSGKLNVDIHDSIFMGNKKCALVLSGSGASLVKPE